MKAVFLFLTFAVSIAFACPGGHLHSLVVKSGQKEVEWAQVDMVSSTVTAGKGSTLVQVLWQPSNSETMQVVCGKGSDVQKCGTYVGINSKLTENPNGILLVTVKNKRTLKFKVTNFRLRRGGCGPTVYPEKK